MSVHIDKPGNPNCNHNKVYANVILTSYPPQRPWICSICGAEGKDCGELGNSPSYDDLIKKFRPQNRDAIYGANPTDRLVNDQEFADMLSDIGLTPTNIGGNPSDPLEQDLNSAGFHAVCDV